MKRAARRTTVATAAVIAVVGLLSAPVSAHVTIDTLGEVEPGGFATLGFNVPNERDDAGTVALEVQMPQDHPLVFVSVQPKPGWEVETTMRTLDEPVEAFGTSFDEVVDTVTWTADDGTRIGPGQFDQFWVSAGPMPEGVDTLEFPALQTYDSGEVVRWIEPTPPGGEEPENPAPVVAFASAAGDASADAATTDDVGDGGDGTTLAVIALIVGGLGLIAGLAGLVGQRVGAVRELRRLSRVGAIALAALAAILVPASLASAHAELRESSPAAGERLTDPPPVISLRFSETVRVARRRDRPARRQRYSDRAGRTRS